MGLKCGIIGLPNVGKSKLFNALTKANIETANFPFCTIKPNIGVVSIPDPRLNQLAKIIKPQRILPTTMEFVDIAGLVKGASKGAGLGNQFLANIRETEAICHVVRCFDNDNIIHVTGQIDPLRDINIINTELALADLDICERTIYRIQKKSKGSCKKVKKELEVLTKCLSHLENAEMLYSLTLSKEELNIISYLNFLTLKPTMYIANVSENGFKKNHYLDTVTSFVKKDGSIIIPLCATIEADFTTLNEDNRDDFITDISIVKTRLNQVIRAGYQLLNLQTYFTIGIKEIRAWTIPQGTTALQAAGKVHTDFEKGFICAQTISFDDFMHYNGAQGAREAGKMRVEGKNYIVQDGDIISFLFNV